jgi:hypothetical protein
MSIESLFQDITVTILNAFQLYIKEKVIPEMIYTFKENDVEIDYESLNQFFRDIEKLPEIENSISVKKSLTKRDIPIKLKSNTTSNNTQSNVSDLLSKIKLNQEANKKQDIKSTDKKEETKKGKQKDNTIKLQNKPDIKALLEKIKAAQQIKSNKEDIPEEELQDE